MNRTNHSNLPSVLQLELKAWDSEAEQGRAVRAQEVGVSPQECAVGGQCRWQEGSRDLEGGVRACEDPHGALGREEPVRAGSVLGPKEASEGWGRVGRGRGAGAGGQRGPGGHPQWASEPPGKPGSHCRALGRVVTQFHLQFKRDTDMGVGRGERRVMGRLHCHPPGEGQ